MPFIYSSIILCMFIRRPKIFSRRFGSIMPFIIISKTPASLAYRLRFGITFTEPCLPKKKRRRSKKAGKFEARILGLENGGYFLPIPQPIAGGAWRRRHHASPKKKKFPLSDYSAPPGNSAFAFLKRN